MSELTSLEAIREAHLRVRSEVHRTPMFSSRRLGDLVGAPLHLKAESLQKTGSFKVRGALNKLCVAEAEARAGVVTISAGNHAQALAWAASRAGVPCTVVMPAGASPTKARASAGYGAEVIVDGPVHEAFELSQAVARERGMLFTHPFDDPDVIAGHGTAGLELIDQVPDLAAVVVPIGGGGLIAGVAAAVKHLRPEARVFGVEPEGAPAMSESLRLGRPAHLEEVSSIADGLAPPMAGVIPYHHVEAFVEDVVLVSDAEIAAAVREIAASTKLVVEPAGAAAVAALLAGRIPEVGGGPVVAILSGGNVDLDRLAGILDPDAA